MNPARSLVAAAALALLVAPGLTAQMPVLRQGSRGPAVALLQVALSDREFSSGPIDGRFGPELAGALRDYQRVRGLADDAVAGPHVWADLGLEIADPESWAFRTVAVQPADTSGLLSVPDDPSQQAKLPVLAYGSVLEKLAERYQATEEYLTELNPDAGWPNPPVGTQVRVPGVKFQTVALHGEGGEQPTTPASADPKSPPDTAAQRIRAQADATAAGRRASATDAPPPADTSGTAPSADTLAPAPEHLASLRKQWEQRAPADVRVVISTRDEALRVYRGEALVARYPATVGSEQFPNPVGEWKIVSQVFAPDYRYDPQYLETGQRSEQALRLPPGPNSLVGILWMGLNKDGYGVHGTNDPAAIGTRASHGCVRLTNWDAERLARHVGIGTVVVITDG